MKNTIQELKKSLQECLIKDQFFITRKINQLGKQNKANDKNNNDKQLASIAASIEKSQRRVLERARAVPKIEYPADLPVSERCEDIKALIKNNQVIILSGETGSGKTTQIPKICLELGLGVKGLIGHTQPRRIAARTVANRIADELHTTMGESVGFKVRFSDHVGERTHIKLMTDGILLAEIQSDRYLLQYEVIIIDEAHERSLNIDFILGYLKTILSKRPDLKVIVTSATIDTDKFSKHFNNAPVIEVSGRTYPVDILYRGMSDKSNSDRNSTDKNDSKNEKEEVNLQIAISDAIFELNRIQHGDTLVFLPGEREIRETAEYLRKHHPPHTEILPLFSRLSVKDQEKIFKPHRGNRVILATNVAETSLTVPGIKYVVDSGLARMSRYSIRSRIQRLPIEAISQAAANQRAGRCGRVSAGICVRLYSEEDYLSRVEFTDPEIMRVNLASVILQMLSMRIGDVFEYPFINKPERKHVNDGLKLLEELGAVNDQQEVTDIGGKLAKLPIDPRLGKMLIEADIEGSLKDVLTIVAFLSIQDPRERPFDAQQKADEYHQRFSDKQSDFMAVLKLWNYTQEQSRHLSQNKFRQLCKKEYLSYMRIREWKDIVVQLKQSLADLNMRVKEPHVIKDKKDSSESAANNEGKKNNENKHNGKNNNSVSDPVTETSYAAIHRPLLSGLLSNIGFKAEGNEFQGTRQKKFFLFPGSHVQKKPPKWVMTSEIVETRRNFGRNAAKIEPEWIAKLADHIVKRNYFEPHWQKKSGQVSAFEKTTLYGLTIIAKKRVNFGAIDPKESREIFIRKGLVEGEFVHQPEFLQYNLALVNDIELLEHKSRRPDILVSDDEMFDFYNEIVPADIHSVAGFNAWLKKQKKDFIETLKFSQKQLIRESADTVLENNYPESILIEGFRFFLSYSFNPGNKNDGLTVVVPISILAQIKTWWFDWLVSGMLLDKVTALIKSLPKSVRKNFVPVPDYSKAFVQSQTPYQKPLLEALSYRLTEISGLNILPTNFDESKVAPYLHVNYNIVDDEGKTISMGQNLAMLQDEFSELSSKAFVQAPVENLLKDDLTCWDFGDLPDEKIVESPHGSFTAYPALVNEKEHVSLRYFSSESEAKENMPDGLLKLITLTIASDVKTLEKKLPAIDKACLLYTKIGNCNELKSEVVNLVLREVFLNNWEDIKTKQAFDELVSAGLPKLQVASTEVCKRLLDALKALQQCKKLIKKNASPFYLEALSDINEQLSSLIYRHFLNDIDLQVLSRLPIYVSAVNRRLEKLPIDHLADRKQMLAVKKYWIDYKKQRENLPQQGNRGQYDQLNEFHWMIEEYRVSLFAQNLKTAFPISSKRLDTFYKSAFLAGK